jgi:hypothetical protein
MSGKGAAILSVAAAEDEKKRVGVTSGGKCFGFFGLVLATSAQHPPKQ